MISRHLTPTSVLILLLLGTCLSYAAWLDSNWINAQLAGSAVILIALAKAWLIGMRYMELDRAIAPLRLAYISWILVVGAVLLALFWQA